MVVTWLSLGGSRGDMPSLIEKRWFPSAPMNKYFNAIHFCFSGFREP